MVTAIVTAGFVILAYLSGSVNFAIIVTRLAVGKDIRTLGNHNPGTSNVGREVGKGYAAIVLVADALKGVVPVVAARLLFFTGESPLEWFLLYWVGIAAVVGHTRPVFYGFRGGGGMATMQGVSLFFVPVEYLASLLIGGTFVLLVLKNVQYKFGRWIPIAFTILTPFVTLATSLLISVPLFGRVSVGGHNLGIVAGSFAMSLMILALNFHTLLESTEDVRQSREQQS